MAKPKSIYVCQNCGTKAAKWIGNCPACKEWNTYVEELEHQVKSGSKTFLHPSKPVPLDSVVVDETRRVETGIGELNRTLGGGMVPGMVALLGGEPGIGKSTLLLQMVLDLKGYTSVYISGEESEEQIKRRADRLGLSNPNCYILCQTSIDQIISELQKLSPAFVIVDSIQTLVSDQMDSAPGTVSQIRHCTLELVRYAKANAVPVMLIGHITKDGSLAGPKVMEHMVDAVLIFEGDNNHVYRILRSVKNRFGSTAEVAVFEMTGKGLSEIANPSEVLVSDQYGSTSGNCIASVLNGTRPMLIEVQSLVSSAAYGVPQRSSTGYDAKRLNMLLAVLEKRAGFRLSQKDVFLNITGGIKIPDTAIDLAIIAAVLSSDQDVPVERSYCFAGEVGLSGEIRGVSRVEHRIAEAEKMGYEKIFISDFNKSKLVKQKTNIEVVGIKIVEDLFRHIFK